MLLLLVTTVVISLMGVKSFYELLRTRTISFTAEMNDFAYEGSIENSYQSMFKNDAVLGMRSGEIRHHLIGEKNNMPFSIFEHVYTVRINNDKRVIRHRVVVLRHGWDWPDVILNRRSSEHKTLCSYKLDPMQLDNKKFNKRYHAEGCDEDFVIYAVSEDIQYMLADRSIKADWRLINGAIVMIEPGRLRARDITRLSEAIERFTDGLPLQLRVELGLVDSTLPVKNFVDPDNTATSTAA